jgi:hypothetical protein
MPKPANPAIAFLATTCGYADGIGGRTRRSDGVDLNQD